MQLFNTTRATVESISKKLSVSVWEAKRELSLTEQRRYMNRDNMHFNQQIKRLEDDIKIKEKALESFINQNPEYFI